MNRWKRVGLFSMISAATSLIAAFLVCDYKFESDFLRVALGAFVVILPCWVLFLPIILLFEKLNLWRSIMFIVLGGLISATVVVGDARYFFVHSPSNRMPDNLWVLKVALESVAVAALACSTYACLLNVIGKHRSSHLIGEGL